MRVVIVEDDPGLGALLARVLREESFDPELCPTAEAGLRSVRAGCDVVVLEWMFPDGDGPGFCEALRRANVDTPILMLTARGEIPRARVALQGR